MKRPAIIALLLLAMLAGRFFVAEGQLPLVMVEYNCENFFDCLHDTLKQDQEFVLGGSRHWTWYKYRQKAERVAKTIVAASPQLPAIVALVEVENDSALITLTRRTGLRGADYSYVMTESPDVRGLDVALLWQPSQLKVLCYDALTVPTVDGMRPTRDILYVKGVTLADDTLHLFVVHAPSRYGGERRSRPFRKQVAKVLIDAMDRVGNKNVIVMGDFNDYHNSASLRLLERHGLVNVTRKIGGRRNMAQGTYKYQGFWNSLDHFLLSPNLVSRVAETYILDEPWLLESDWSDKGWKPFRTSNGWVYNNGYSDHLPLVVTLNHR